MRRARINVPLRSPTVSTTVVYLVAGGAWLFSWLVKRWLKSTYAEWSEVPNQHRITGAQTAAAILAANNVRNVEIQAVRGRLTDHYDPLQDILRLSKSNYSSRSIASMAVSAHEAGHALQDATDDLRLRIRRWLVPVAAAGGRFGPPIAIFGMFTGSGTMLRVGAFLLAGTILFQLMTLPVEFNASRRAMSNLKELGLTDPAQQRGARQVLTAAAFTYVAAAATTIAWFSFLLVGGRGRPTV